jgi:hypothetical protein
VEVKISVLILEEKEKKNGRKMEGLLRKFIDVYLVKSPKTLRKLSEIIGEIIRKRV